MSKNDNEIKFLYCARGNSADEEYVQGQFDSSSLAKDPHLGLKNASGRAIIDETMSIVGSFIKLALAIIMSIVSSTLL